MDAFQRLILEIGIVTICIAIAILAIKYARHIDRKNDVLEREQEQLEKERDELSERLKTLDNIVIERDETVKEERKSHEERIEKIESPSASDWCDMPIPDSVRDAFCTDTHHDDSASSDTAL